MKTPFLFLLLAAVCAAQTLPVNVQKAPSTNEITANLVIPTARTLTINSAVTFGDGVTQTFNPSTTSAGINVGSTASDPATPNNGDAWYNSGTNTFNFRINGATAQLSATPAPTDATYITQTASSGLSAEQALSSLSTGLMQVTTSTGVISSVTTSSGLAGLISDETGSGALVFGTSPTIATPSITGAAAWGDGVRQTFNPNGTTPGLNVGSHTADPSTPSNGDLWYDSTGNLLRARINGSTVSLGAGGGGGISGPGSSTDNAIVRWDGTGGTAVQNSNVTLGDSGTDLVFSGAAGITASGSNNSVTLTPTGTGTNVLTSGWRVGTASSTAATGNTIIYGTDSATSTLSIRRADESTGGPQFFGSKARGSMGSPTAPTSGDRLFAIAAGGYNGSAWSDTQSLFGFSASQNWSSGAMGTSFSIGLTPNGSTTRADAFTITGSGSGGVVAVLPTTASTSTTTGALTVGGGVGIAGATYIGGILNISTSTPASASAAGVAGTIAWDSSYIYICTATNTWKRVAIATWP